MTKEIFTKIIDSLLTGENDATTTLTSEGLAAGLEPLEIIEQGLVPGITLVGEKFESGEFFLPHLVIAAEGMKKAMQILEPELKSRQQEVKSVGKVVIGTVQGDIHEIGKSLVATMLSVNGFQVYDLGMDVPIETFIAKIRETGANFLGLSALLTTTMVVQQEIIEGLKQAGLRQQVKVMVGGAPVTRDWAEEIGADGYAEDAIGAVALAKKLAGE